MATLSYLYAQTVTIIQPSANQPFCASGPFTIPVQGIVAGNTAIEWFVTIDSKTYKTCTQSGEVGYIEVTMPPQTFGTVQVRAMATSSSQQFSGTGSYYGNGALYMTVLEGGANYEGYVLLNCNDDEQDMVVGQQTDQFPAGTSSYIRGYCTDAEADIPSIGAVFGSPWTSESTSHWAYWERKVVIYGNENNYSDDDILGAIWYISDRSGIYNSILSNIGYPVNGPTKNFIIDVTPPIILSVTDDGDTTEDNNQLHATWSAEDYESGIVEYQYAIGTSPGATDVVDWISAGGIPEVTHTGLNLDQDWHYFTVKAQNGSGLWSEPVSSDGILVIGKGFSEKNVYNFPNPFSPGSDEFTAITFSTRTAGSVDIHIYDTGGNLVWSKEVIVDQGKYYINWNGKNMQGRTVANGTYFCKVAFQGKTVIKKIAVLQ